MLRFIISRTIRDANSDCAEHLYETIDIDVPELERALFGGGYGPDGYDTRHLIGAECLPKGALGDGGGS